MKKILFVNDEMTVGGVSRILNTLLKKLDQNKYEIDLLILHPHGDMMNEIPDGINLIDSTSFFNTIDLSLNEIINSKDIIKLIKKIYLLFLMKTGLIKSKIKLERKKILKKNYDIEFAAKEGFCTIFTAFGDSKFKYNWVQVDYEESNYSKNHMKLMNVALKEINLNLACSSKVASAYLNVFHINNIEVLHNLMDEEKIKNLMTVNCNYPFSDGIKLISVARFHYQKSIDRLVLALDYVKNLGYNVNLVLIGGGTLERDLKNLVLKLNLTKNVKFLGYQKNPYCYIKEADCFILSSLYEGYPTIVLESLISTTPVLACEVAGVREQIIDECDGWIINNTQESLNEGLKMLCQSKENLKKFKEELKNYKTENVNIMNRLEEHFDEE